MYVSHYIIAILADVSGRLGHGWAQGDANTLNDQLNQLPLYRRYGGEWQPTTPGTGGCFKWADVLELMEERSEPSDSAWRSWEVGGRYESAGGRVVLAVGETFVTVVLQSTKGEYSVSYDVDGTVRRQFGAKYGTPETEIANSELYAFGKLVHLIEQVDPEVGLLMGSTTKWNTRYPVEGNLGREFLQLLLQDAKHAELVRYAWEATAVQLEEIEDKISSLRAESNQIQNSFLYGAHESEGEVIEDVAVPVVDEELLKLFGGEEA